MGVLEEEMKRLSAKCRAGRHWFRRFGGCKARSCGCWCHSSKLEIGKE